jgi:hypothetical protein
MERYSNKSPKNDCITRWLETGFHQAPLDSELIESIGFDGEGHRPLKAACARHLMAVDTKVFL